MTNKRLVRTALREHGESICNKLNSSVHPEVVKRTGLHYICQNEIDIFGGKISRIYAIEHTYIS